MTIKQQKTTRIMSVMNPEIQAIQKKYKDKKDQASMMKMQEETKLVYQKYGTSPTGGCLGSLIQLPILFALWPVVGNIPAYVGKVKAVYGPLVQEITSTKGYEKIIDAFAKAKSVRVEDNLTKNNIIDVLYKFQDADWSDLVEKFPKLTDVIETTKENISTFNDFLGINIAENPSGMFSTAWDAKDYIMVVVAVMIPLLAGITQWINMKVSQNATKSKNNQTEENAMANQMNTMLKIMPVFSVVMCFSMPSGLGIYWITSAVVRTIQQICINKYLDRQSLDDMIKNNLEKAAKKNKKKDAVEASIVNQRAQTSTRNIEKKTTSNNNVDSYKPNAKPGSLAAKANMVSDFNNRNKKEDK